MKSNEKLQCSLGLKCFSWHYHFVQISGILNIQKQVRQICNKMKEIKRKESVVGSGQWAPASYEYKLDTTAYTKGRLSQLS